MGDGVEHSFELQTHVPHTDQGGEGPEHVVGSFANHVDPGVPHHPLERLIGEVRGAAVNLKGVIDDLPKDFGGEDFEHGRFQHEVSFAGIDEGCRLIGAGFHRKRPGLHVRQFFFHKLEAAERLAKLHAGIGVGHRPGHAIFRRAGATRAKRGAAEVEDGESDPQTFAERTKDVFLRHEHVLESEAAGGGAADAAFFHSFLHDLKAGHVGRDEKGGDF